MGWWSVTALVQSPLAARTCGQVLDVWKQVAEAWRRAGEEEQGEVKKQ